MTKKQAGVIAVIAVPAAAVVLTAVVFSLYLFFGGFDDAAEASLDDADLIVNPTFHVRVQKGRISWETGCRSSLHFCFLRCGVA